LTNSQMSEELSQELGLWGMIQNKRRN
jgi:hypothetical protein